MIYGWCESLDNSAETRNGQEERVRDRERERRKRQKQGAGGQNEKMKERKGGNVGMKGGRIKRERKGGSGREVEKEGREGERKREGEKATVQLDSFTADLVDMPNRDH